MAISLTDNIRIGQQKPIDDKYFNGFTPYTSTNEVNSSIPEEVRHIGLTVNINGEEYWYKSGIENEDLIFKSTQSIIEVTKYELDNLISSSQLVKGSLYKILDVDPNLYGGTSIFLTAIENNKLSIEGYGVFYNPKYDKSIDGFGIVKDYLSWTYKYTKQDSGVYNIGDRVIWGGKYWNCISPTLVDTTYIFDRFYLSPVYFEEIPFNETDYNVVHDKIKYDYENDLIVERDEYNSNVVSFSYNFLTELYNSTGLTASEVNPIKNFQWGNLFDDNLQKGIGNNKIKDYLHVNINFSGSYQINLLYDGFIYCNDKYLSLGESGVLSTVSIKSEGSLSTDKVLKINNNSNTLLELNGAGGLGIGVGSDSQYKLLIKAQEEIGGLNRELLSSSGWTSAGWTGDFTTGFTHTVGNTSILSHTFSGGSSSIYVINIKISNRTAGSIDFRFGSIIRTSLTSSTIIADEAITSSKLNITPTSDFNGTVIVSIRQPSPYNATIGIVNSSGFVVGEIRASDNNSNSFFGYQAGRYNAGSINSFFGSFAGSSNISGNYNSFFGAMSGVHNLEGNRNSYFGVESGKINLGSENSFFGYRSGYSTSNGYALSNATNSVFIGYDTKANTYNETNQIVIGHTAIGNGSNSVTLGNDSITKTILKGNVGIGGITTPTEKLEVAGSVKASGFKTTTGTPNQGLKADGGVFDLNTKADLVGGKVPYSQLPYSQLPSNKTTFTYDILVSNWTLVSGKYEAVISNAGILANSFIDVIPSNDNVDIVRSAQIYPSVLISAGSVKVYSKFLPSDTITVTINII
jgi:hypothetical protein